MENRKKDLSAMAAEAGKSVSKFWNKAVDKAVKVVDQNDDGKFDLKDIASISNSIEEAAKDKVAKMKESADQRAREKEFATLQPIFDKDLDDTDFSLPKFISVTERDKKHQESELCKDSIGCYIDQKDVRLVNIFLDCLNQFELSFYPDMESEFYYVDPCDRDHYIAINQYVNYMKFSRINELQKIAQDLGAKHFKVVYLEEQSSSSSSKGGVKEKAALNSKNNAGGEVSASRADSQYSKMEVAAEMTFLGHPPIQPTLHYLKRDPFIQTLVSMRAEDLTSQKLKITLIDTLGMKESEAAKVDAAIKGIKGTSSFSIQKEVEREKTCYFEYEIDF